MGRVKSIAVKSLANELMQKYGPRFTIGFENNKTVLGEVCPIKSKKIRNVLAGYLVTKVLLKDTVITGPKRVEEDEDSKPQRSSASRK